MNKKMTKEEIYDLLEGDNTVEVSATPGKHSSSWRRYRTKIDEKYYEFSLEFDYSWGLQHDSGDYVEFVEVRPVEKTIIDWEPV